MTLTQDEMQQRLTARVMEHDVAGYAVPAVFRLVVTVPSSLDAPSGDGWWTVHLTLTLELANNDEATEWWPLAQVQTPVAEGVRDGVTRYAFDYVSAWDGLLEELCAVTTARLVAMGSPMGLMARPPADGGEPTDPAVRALHAGETEMTDPATGETWIDVPRCPRTSTLQGVLMS